MATTYRPARMQGHARRLGPIYAWTGFIVMWLFWVCFVVFLADPPWAPAYWPLPTMNGNDGGLSLHPLGIALIDLALIGLFGLQHSIMARPGFKSRLTMRMPPAFERCTFVYAANLALFALIIFWQPIPIEVWSAASPVRELIWAAFVAGWIILLLGALSFGIFELLGIEQMRAWSSGLPLPERPLKTTKLYRWLRHPMYVGVLLAIWATPRMTVGHLLLAVGMTTYVLIAMRYEERDLVARFGRDYATWRSGDGARGEAAPVHSNIKI